MGGRLGRPPRPPPPPSPRMVLPAGGGGDIQVREGRRGRGEALEHGLIVALQHLRECGSQLPASSLAHVVFWCWVLQKSIRIGASSQNFARQIGARPGGTHFSSLFFHRFLRRIDCRRERESHSSRTVGGLARPTWACSLSPPPNVVARRGPLSLRPLPLLSATFAFEFRVGVKLRRLPVPFPTVQSGK